MPLLDTPDKTGSPQTKIVAAVSAQSSESLGRVLKAVDGQVYEIDTVFVLGSGEADGVETLSSLSELLDRIERTVTHVWLVHDDAIPRPDALGALVAEAIRTDASVAG